MTQNNVGRITIATDRGFFLCWCAFTKVDALSALQHNAQMGSALMMRTGVCVSKVRPSSPRLFEQVSLWSAIITLGYCRDTETQAIHFASLATQKLARGIKQNGAWESTSTSTSWVDRSCVFIFLQRNDSQSLTRVILKWYFLCIRYAEHANVEFQQIHCCALSGQGTSTSVQCARHDLWIKKLCKAQAMMVHRRRWVAVLQQGSCMRRNWLALIILWTYTSKL